MVKTQVARRAKWVSLFLSFSYESLRTLWQHTAEYLSHSVYHSCNVSWCFKWLGHLSCMVRWRNVRLHGGEKRRWWKAQQGMKRGERHRCVRVCVFARVCAWDCVRLCILITSYSYQQEVIFTSPMYHYPLWFSPCLSPPPQCFFFLSLRL